MDIVVLHYYLSVKKRKIVCFDFDGTLIKKDSFIELIIFRFGRLRLYLAMMLFLPWLMMMAFHLYDAGKVKEKIFCYFFKGMAIFDFETLCQRFADKLSASVNKEVMKMLLTYQRMGCEVVVVSASVRNWIEPLFQMYSSITIISTEIEIVHDRLTGRFITKNCNCSEKVSRINAAIDGEADHVYLVAVGDSKGDYPMLCFANEGYLVKKNKIKAFQKPDTIR